MEGSQESSAEWALKKAEEYLESASGNMKSGRLFPAAEEIFRAVETLLEAMLYHFGIREIEYPGTKKPFTGRLALQFLVRDNLLHRGRLSREVYGRYMTMATELHLAGYTPDRMFEPRELQENLEFAEDLFIKVKAMVRR